MIQVQNLTKKFGARVALDDVSFEVRRGDIVGFLGPNGAGKTTTMRILTGFIPPTTGSVTVGGFDVVTQHLEARRLIGYLPEQVPLYPELRVREYLKFRARLKGVDLHKVNGAVDRVIEECQLKEVEKRIVGQLSKGYRQRVGLADALVSSPPILILDEPTIGLDPSQVRQTRELIRSLGGGRTLLLSTHILSEVEAVCDRVLVIDRGRIVGEGTPKELSRQLLGESAIRAEVRGKGVTEGKIRSIQGVGDVELKPNGEISTIEITTSRPPEEVEERLFALCVENGWVLRSLYRRAPSLEEIFVRMVGKAGKEKAEAFSEKG